MSASCSIMLLATLLTAWMLLTPAYATFEHMDGYGGGKQKKGYGGGYGLPPIGGYGIPPVGGYGMPPKGGYGMPPIGGYGMPPIGGYGMPPVGGYGMPPIGGYGMPPIGGYGMPPIGGYGMPPVGGGYGHGGVQTMPIVIVPIKYGGFEGGGISGSHFGAPTGFHIGPSQGFGFEHTKGFGMSQGGFGNYGGFGRASQGNSPTVVVDQARPNVVVQQAPRAVQQATQGMTPIVSVVAAPENQQKARFHHMPPMLGSPCQTAMHHPAMFHQQPQMVHSLAASHAYIH